VAPDAEQEAAQTVVRWLLDRGAYPTVKDGWGHDVFDLACTDPASNVGVDPSRANGKVAKLLTDYIQRNEPNRQTAHNTEHFDLCRTQDELELARAGEMLGAFCSVETEEPAFVLDVEQADALIGNMLKDDPSAGAKGDGWVAAGCASTIGLLQAEFSVDSEHRALLPAELMVGLFDGSCDTPVNATVRLSHTIVSDDTKLLRMHVKIDAGAGHTNLTVTESIRNFPIDNKKQMDAFVYGQQNGTAMMCLWHPTGSIPLLKNRADSNKELSRGKGAYSKRASVLGKSYYSLAPYSIGPAAAKFAFKSDMRAATSNEATKEGVQARVIADVGAADVVFDFMIQVATDPVKQPIHNAAECWDESTAPYIKMGELRIKQQEIHGSGSPTAGISTHFDDALSNMQLSFETGEGELHQPVGYVNQFRTQLYSRYDEARRKQLGENAVDNSPPVAPSATFGLLHM